MYPFLCQAPVLSAVDYLSAAAIAVGLVAIGLIILEWRRLGLAQHERQLTRDAVARLEGKVDRLGASVSALRSAIESKVQKLQLDDLERQVAVSTAQIKQQIDMVDGLGASSSRIGTTTNGPRGVTMPALPPNPKGVAVVPGQSRGVSASLGRLRERLNGR